MNPPIRAGIAGSAGYTGGELIRLLLRHPHTHIQWAHSDSQAGRPVASVHRDLTGETDLYFSAEMDPESIDVLFLCYGHGAARRFLEAQRLPDTLRIIDLSNDFRLPADADFSGRRFVYGLPESNRADIQSARNIANPGCFATAIQLALLPLAVEGHLSEAHVTGITGATGAGQSLQETLHFPWRAQNISAYKTLRHQHVAEIRQTLGQWRHPAPDIHFIPWRGDFTRGIFISACVAWESGWAAAQALYENYYRQAAFTHLSADPIDMKQVVNTNKCLIHLEWHEGQLAIHSTLDNLLKGAAGQAVQNMNLMFGCEETAGLQLKASGF